MKNEIRLAKKLDGSKIYDNSYFSISYNHSIIAKAVAILMVMICHISQFLNFPMLSFLGQIGVAIFLILSGYGLNESYKKKGLTKFWESKLIRVMIPYWIVIVIFDFWKMSITDFGLLFFCIGSFHWFVGYIMMFYLIFWVIKKVENHINQHILFILSGILIMMFCDNMRAGQAFSFYIGVILSQYCYKLENKTSIFISIFLLFIGFSIILIKKLTFINEYQGQLIYGLIYLLSNLPIGLFLIFILKDVSNKILNIIGVISWELYLIHCSILRVFLTNPTMINLLLFFILSFSLSYCFYKSNTFIFRLFTNHRMEKI